MSLFSRNPYKSGSEPSEEAPGQNATHAQNDEADSNINTRVELGINYDDSLDKALDAELEKITQSTRSSRSWSSNHDTTSTEEPTVQNQQHKSSETTQSKLSFRKPRTLEQQLDMDFDAFKDLKSAAASNSMVTKPSVTKATTDLFQRTQNSKSPSAGLADKTAQKPTTPAGTTTASTSKVSTPATKQYMDYGINQTIALLNRLPEAGDPSVLMTIVKRTLEATGVNIQDIIKDSQRKKHDIKSNVKHLEAQVRDLEKQLEAKKSEIASLTDDLSETDRVQSLLELAEVPPAQGYDGQNKSEKTKH